MKVVASSFGRGFALYVYELVVWNERFIFSPIEIIILKLQNLIYGSNSLRACISARTLYITMSFKVLS